MNLNVRTCAALSLFLAMAGLYTDSAAQAQGTDRSVPGQVYHNSFDALHAGEYEDAMQGFRDAARGGIRSTEGRWIDSICYHAMIGECYFQMGDLPNALEQYDAALSLYLAHHEWMLHVDFPPQISPSNNALTNIRWGTRTRRTRLGHFPDRMGVMTGRLNNEDAVRQGGVVDPPRIRPVDVVEILRCTALVLRRKSEIMGPAAPHDRLVSQMVTALSERPAPPNHWSQPWIDAQLGLAYLCAGDETQAAAHLQNSLVVAGEYDHPLTAISLLELGKLAMKSGRYEPAAIFFAEASFDAAGFGNGIVLEEAFRWGTLNHIVAGWNGTYAPLATAADWARRKDLFHVQASIYLSMAESMALSGQTRNAMSQLESAGRVLVRRDMREGVIGARHNYLSAIVRFQQGNLAAGTNSLAAAMNFQSGASPRLFQIAMVDSLFIGGGLTARNAEVLYDKVLAEPGPDDWILDPMDTLAVTITPHPLPLEHWFEVALERGEHEKALQIADQIRRHRFYTTLPLGGRLLALRWILEAPDASLTVDARLQRQDLMAKYPGYAELSQAATAIGQQLRQIPPDPENVEVTRQRVDLLEQLGVTSAGREIILHEIALRREPSEFIFPPRRKVNDIQEALPESTLVVAYLSTSRGVFAFLFNHEHYTHWKMESPGDLQGELGLFLRQIGNFGENTTIDGELLRDNQWKESGRQLLTKMLPSMQPEHWEKYDELVIIPDGLLWHVPFEALQVGLEGEPTRSLGSLTRVRYAPTLGLMMPDDRGHHARGNTAVILGQLFPRDDDQIAEEAFEELQAVMEGTVGYRNNLPAPSALLAADWDRLIVLDDINEIRGLPYDWAPAQLDHQLQGSHLDDWMALPWHGPQQVLLPGFHTTAEGGLRNASSGNEIFLSVCGFMASGSRTVLLSRWRVGGQSSHDLIREFLQEAPHTSASDAWQRSVQTVRNRRLDLTREPRLEWKNDFPEEPTAEHPFFWAGYLLIDTGSEPPSEE